MRFRYTALNNSGKTENGFVDADGEFTAKDRVKNKGLYLISIKEEVEKTDKKHFVFSSGIRQKLPIQLARQLASLLRGGVPLFQALTIISNQLDSDEEKEIVTYLKDEVKGGAFLSDALKTYPHIFDELFIYSVQAGERSGALETILNYQANLLEKRSIIRGKIKAAMVYPAIMAIVGTGVLLFLIGYVVPMVIKIFERMNQGLPTSTKILIGVTNIINNHYYLFFIIAAILYGAWVWMKKSNEVQRIWHRFLLRAPIFGDFYMMVAVSRFSTIMGTLLKSGIPMLQALLAVSRTVKNTIISEAIVKIASMVEEGSDLSASIRETGVFPTYVADMIAVGESSGNIEGMLTTVADYYENNINTKITSFTAMVEPLIILIIGVIVAFVLVSILLPLFEINKIIMKK
ncbi:MAG TPA: type II secretion system F family protein [Syntrophorhabdaceae bacterium]|jgi:general secretion pathway protein F|nr:type II secretion system F family protein [Syntrophorhabdaceae bacterium]